MPATPEAHQRFRELMHLPDESMKARCRQMPVGELLEVLLAGAEQLNTMVEEFGRSLQDNDDGVLKSHAASRAQVQALLGRLKP